MADANPDNPPQATEATDATAQVDPAAAAVEEALEQAQQAVDGLSEQAAEATDPAAVATATEGAPDESLGHETVPRNIDLPNFQQVLQDVEANGIRLLSDVDLNVKIELGRTHMLVEDVLRLAQGSVVELDKLAGDPVDVFVNDQLVARGEVLVLNDSFCVRVSEIVAVDSMNQAEEPVPTTG